MTDEERSEIAEAFDKLFESLNSKDLPEADPESNDTTKARSVVDLDSAETDEANIWYPTKEDILDIHDEVIETGGEPGIRDPDQLDFVIDQIRGGPAGYGPQTLPEKSFALMRYLAANHYFVDGNKRTALATTEVFLNFNGVELQYGDEVRTFLKRLAQDESSVSTAEGIAFLRERMVTDIEEMSLSTAVMFLLRWFDDEISWADRKD